MEIRINETGELKTLIINADKSREDITYNLLENSGTVKTSTKEYNMSLKDYNYWSNWIKQNEELAKERDDLIEQLTGLGLNGSEIISEAYMTTDFGSDLSLHHVIKKQVLEDIKSRYIL